MLIFACYEVGQIIDSKLAEPERTDRKQLAALTGVSIETKLSHCIHVSELSFG